MTLTAELITAFAGFLSVLFASYAAWQATKRATQKEEAALQQAQIELLTKQLQETRDCLELEIRAKRQQMQRVAVLEALLLKRGIEFPPEPPEPPAKKSTEEP